MGLLISRRYRLSIGFLSLVLVLTACSGGSRASDKDAKVALQAEPAAATNAGEVPVTSSDEEVESLSVNVMVTDESFQPPSIFIPAGRRVRLVLRNRGTTEHHFRILELSPQDLLWQAPVEDTADTDGDEDSDHAHHQTSLVPFRATSPAGVRPMGDEVHAFAEAGMGDIVVFTATESGTFLAHCPLHPEITGKVTVYGNAGRQTPVSPVPTPTPVTTPKATPPDPKQVSLKSAAALRELIPLLTRTETSSEGIDFEALYEAPALFELTGRAPRQFGIAFTVSESVHDEELPEGVTAFVLTVDDKGPFKPLQVKRFNDDPHHRVTYYVFPANDSNGAPLMKGGHQVLTLSVASNGRVGTSSIAALVWHLPISPSTPSSASTTISLTDAQIIQVDSNDKIFKPGRLTLTKGRRVVLVFRNIGSMEHHLHALTMPVKGIQWFAPAQPGTPVPASLDSLQSAPFLPYHVCDSESGICPSGLDVHLHARAGDWLAVSFVPSTAGTFTMECSLHPYKNGTIVVK